MERERVGGLRRRLHRLPSEGFPTAPGPLLERSLDEIRGAIHPCGLDGLTPGLKWLAAHRPAPPAAPCIVHLDFHRVGRAADAAADHRVTSGHRASEIVPPQAPCGYREGVL